MALVRVSPAQKRSEFFELAVKHLALHASFSLL